MDNVSEQEEIKDLENDAIDAKAEEETAAKANEDMETEETEETSQETTTSKTIPNRHNHT